MSDLTGTLSVDISGLSGGNPLPLELVSAEAMTATATPATYTGEAIDLGTVASAFTLVGTPTSPSFTPDVSLPAWQGGTELSEENPAAVASASITLEGSLDGTYWYALVSSGANVYTPDGSTALASSSPAVTPAGSPLARYIRASATLTLDPLYSIPNNPYTAFTVTSASVTLTVYAGVQL